MAKKKRLHTSHLLLRKVHLLKITVLFAAVWIITVFYFLLRVPQVEKIKKEQNDVNGVDLQDQLAEAVAHQKEMLEVNRELRRKLESALDAQKSIFARFKRIALQQKKKSSLITSPVSLEVDTDIFSKEYEMQIRKINRKLWENFYSFRRSFASFGTDHPSKTHIEDQFYSLLAESSRLAEIDGSAEWRRQSLQQITDFIQKKLWNAQNPSNCTSRKFIVCDMKMACGFGCQVHHLAYCLLVTFASGRTLVLNDGGKKWSYQEKGWSTAFKAISSCSPLRQDTSSFDALPIAEKRTNLSMDHRKLIRLEAIDSSSYRPDFLPPSIPMQFADDLIKLHSNPPAFFIAQFVWYVMRMTSDFENTLRIQSSQIPFNSGPVVGVHVRRGHKLNGAGYYPVEHYMMWSEIYFKIQDRLLKRNVTRRVYVASDASTVLPEIQKKYPHYIVYGNTNFAEAAKIRFSKRSLRGVLVDVMMLSKCDYIIGTFSSHISRLAYELMLLRRGDDGNNYHSLDENYHFAGQNQNYHIAVESHTQLEESEMALRVGDLISIRKNHHDGYATGFNRRSGKMGRIPMHKVEEQWQIVDFPILNDTLRR